MDVHGYSAAIILHSDDIALGKQNRYGCAGSDQSLVNGIVDDFEYKLVQTIQAGGANVHAGALPNMLQTFENLNVVCAVAFVHGMGV